MATKAGGEQQRPHIELYMYSLNQEFPVAKGHETFLKRFSQLQQDLSGKLVERHEVESQIFQTGLGLSANLPPDWSVQWLQNQWIENHTKAAGVGIRPELDPLRNALLREEDFGGILFEPFSDRVFKLNKAGVTLFRALKQDYESTGELRSRAIAGFSKEQVESFVNYLKAAGLWIPK